MCFVLTAGGIGRLTRLQAVVRLSSDWTKRKNQHQDFQPKALCQVPEKYTIVQAHATGRKPIRKENPSNERVRSEIGLYESLAGTSRQAQESTVLSFCACFLQEIDFWYKQAGITILEAQACENVPTLRFRLRFQRLGYYFEVHSPRICRVCCRQIIA